jgi:hypothetical protein
MLLVEFVNFFHKFLVKKSVPLLVQVFISVRIYKIGYDGRSGLLNYIFSSKWTLLQLFRRSASNKQIQEQNVCFVIATVSSLDFVQNFLVIVISCQVVNTIFFDVNEVE